MLLLRTKSYPIQGYRFSNNEYELPNKFKTVKTTFTSLPKLTTQLTQDLHSKTVQNLKAKAISRLSLQSFKEMEIEKSLTHNKLTINLSDLHQFNNIPKVINMQNVHQSLISDEAFEHFRKLNAVNGRYQSALSELQKVQQKKHFRLKVEKKARVKTRKNIFQMKRLNDSQHLSNTSELANEKNLEHNQKDADSQVKFAKTPNRDRPKCSIHFDSKWQLTDFFNSLVTPMQTASKLELAESRAAFLGKLMRIADSCDDVEKQNKTKTYLSLFQKYTQNLSSKLQKKRRKLAKVQVAFGKQPPILEI